MTVLFGAVGAVAVSQVSAPGFSAGSKVRLICMECGRAFWVRSAVDPRCPRCGSVDLEMG